MSLRLRSRSNSSKTAASTVVIVQDAFTSYFESALVLDFIDFLQALDINVQVAPFSPNGKPMHVHGFLGAFEASAKKSAKGLKQISDEGALEAIVDELGAIPTPDQERILYANVSALNERSPL